MHVVVPGKFIAFRGPSDIDNRAAGQKRVKDYIGIFKHLGVHTIVRLNEPEYSKSTFVQAGFEHQDQIFQDCSVPNGHIVDTFLRCAEALQPGQVVAVHCLAGLGRTGTLIALYMMKHLGFTANEAMGWLRIARPGSIIGPQQQFLADHESLMHKLGAMEASGLGQHLNDECPSPCTESACKMGSAQTKILADMVRDGMLSRRKLSAASTHEADLDDVASREHFLRSQSSSSWRSVDSFHSASSSADFSRTPSAACIDFCVVY